MRTTFTADRIALLAIIAALLALSPISAEAQSSAKVSKAMKEYGRAAKQQAKRESRSDNRLHKPDSAGPPPGKGWRQEEFNIADLRPKDLGISLVNRDEGIIISRIEPRVPMARYGFREGDRILEVDGHEIGREKEFFQYLFGEDVRWSRVGVLVLRNGREKEIMVSPGELVEAMNPPRREDPLHKLGIELGDRAGNDLRIADILPQSPAEAAGLRRGDVIYRFDNQEVESARELVRVLDRLDPGDYFVHVERDASTRKIAIDLPE